MEENKYYRQKCEQYLSPFGKKVLHFLIKQSEKDLTKRNERDDSQHRRLTQNNKKILNFNNESSYASVPETPLPPPPPISIYETDATFNVNLFEFDAPGVPTTESLTKTLELEQNISNDDFVHPTIVSRNIVHDLFNKESDDETNQRPFTKANNLIKNIITKSNGDVNWDNMFDSELFSDVANDNAGIKKIEIVSDITSTTLLKDLDVINTNFPVETNNGKKRKSKNITLLLWQSGKNTTNSKTVKKIKKDEKPNDPNENINKTCNPVSKNSFRKQTYKKTVKNWLNNVEACNYNNNNINMESTENIETDNVATSSTNKIEVNTATAIKKLNITIDKSMKNIKKVVQATLANKDGVMKFAKPKQETVTKKTEASETKEKDKKDKLTRKFAPPIKSQIPVKDITYDMVNVDDGNVAEYQSQLKSIVNTEIVAVLISSNGFCQLNNHFTDDACTVIGIILDIGDVFYCFKNAGQRAKEVLTYTLQSNKVICYHAQAILIYLASNIGLEINAVNTYDVKIGASLLDPDNPPENFSDLQKLLSLTPSYTIATECVLQKTAWYMVLLRESWMKLKDSLVEDQLWQIFVDIEMKLLPIIAEMEHRGVSIDVSKLKSMEEVLLSRMKLIERECHEAAGKTFQINSTVQVRGILYDELQLDVKCNVKIRETLAGGVKSTSETMLRSLMTVHPLPKLILEYRHLHKAHATFLAGIAQHVKDGVVRPTWVQTAAATGRIASNNPNLQAIPKTPFNLVMFPDAENTDNVQLNFRSVYVARAGYTLVAADFKHVECRVFAHVAADTGLLRALSQSDDLFKVLAAQWLSKSPESVSNAERERTKRLVYASLYGAGTRKLMEILEVSYEQALQVAASFNRTFPALKGFGRHVVSRCSQAGGRLSTLCGRVRRFVNISSEDFALRSHAERQAVNFVVQGSAADLCKTAMILTENELRHTTPAVEAHLLLQIHDELVWEVRSDHVDKAAGIIKRVMEGCGVQCGMSISLPVAISAGHNWANMEDYVPHTQ